MSGAVKRKIAVEYRMIESLSPYKRNARVHPTEQIAQLAASIDEFGFVGAVVVRDGTLAKGHGTIEAVRALYAQGKTIYPAPGRAAGEIPGAEPIEPFPAGTIPVLDVRGWTDAQFRAYVLADNKLALNAGWDEGLLALELADLKQLGFAVELAGFEPDELDQTMRAASSGVSAVEISQLQDRFWISLRGPLKQQALVLKALRDATANLEGVEVELGTINALF